jgi:hypothetical protein
MERRLQQASFARLMRARPVSRGDRRSKGRDFATVLMGAAVVGVLCQITGTVISVGRSAGWWQ